MAAAADLRLGALAVLICLAESPMAAWVPLVCRSSTAGSAGAADFAFFFFFLATLGSGVVFPLVVAEGS